MKVLSHLILMRMFVTASIKYAIWCKEVILISSLLARHLPDWLPFALIEGFWISTQLGLRKEK